MLLLDLPDDELQSIFAQCSLSTIRAAKAANTTMRRLGRIELSTGARFADRRAMKDYTQLMASGWGSAPLCMVTWISTNVSAAVAAIQDWPPFAKTYFIQGISPMTAMRFSEAIRGLLEWDDENLQALRRRPPRVARNASSTG